MRDSETLAEAVLSAIRPVIDPELGESIVDLGMIYGVAVTPDGDASILMTTTARFCPAADLLRAAVTERIGAVPGISSVEIKMTYDPPWTPDMISGAARRLF